MAVLHEGELTNLQALSLHASEAGVVKWQGHQALRLVDGLALIPGLEAGDVSIEVWMGAENPAYPGVAFRVADVANYELVYTVPHASGLWDALQYDPVFHGSNTWQLYHGPSYQKEATVPMGDWFRLKVDVHGDRAVFTVGDQPPLDVGGLAHGSKQGLLGVWTFRPAYFRDLRVSECQELPESMGVTPLAPEWFIHDWFVEGFGVVQCEPSGILNLNRHLPASVEEVMLIRRFEALSDGELQLYVGFSDELSLELDEKVVFEGSNTFAGFGNYEERGYAYAGMSSLSQNVSKGVHRLTAKLKVTETFGWGMILAVGGVDVQLLPAALG